jgi:hypothetical protein
VAEHQERTLWNTSAMLCQCRCSVVPTGGVDCALVPGDGGGVATEQQCADMGATQRSPGLLAAEHAILALVRLGSQGSVVRWRRGDAIHHRLLTMS